MNRSEAIQEIADLYGERPEDMTLVFAGFSDDVEAVKEYSMRYLVYGVEDASWYFREWLGWQ